MPKGGSGRNAATTARSVETFGDIPTGLRQAFISGLKEDSSSSFYARYSEQDIEAANIRYWNGGQTERVYAYVGTGGTRGSAQIWVDTSGRSGETGKRNSGTAMDAAFRNAKNFMLENREDIFAIMRARTARR